jgi:hypothetical protein
VKSTPYPQVYGDCRADSGPSPRPSWHLGHRNADVCNSSNALPGLSPPNGLQPIDHRFGPLPNRHYRLPKGFGADAQVVDMLEAISTWCIGKKEKHPGRRCQAYLPDLSNPRPPTCLRRRESAFGRLTAKWNDVRRIALVQSAATGRSVDRPRARRWLCRSCGSSRLEATGITPAIALAANSRSRAQTRPPRHRLKGRGPPSRDIPASAPSVRC